MEGINLKREDVKNCKCGKSANDEKFRGSYSGSICSHFKSDKVRWLRIDHKEDLTENGFERGQDIIGELMCKECLDGHSSRFNELMEGVL